MNATEHRIVGETTPVRVRASSRWTMASSSLCLTRQAVR
jgi:hypothetical protein